MGMRLIPKESAQVSECTLNNLTNIVILHDAADKFERMSRIDQCMFSGGAENIVLKGEGVVKDEILVTSYNGQPGQDFQLFYLAQAPTAIVPQDIPGKRFGAPVAGLTNRQAWDQYGVAVAGAVSPTSARRNRITAFVQPLAPGRAEALHNEALTSRLERQQAEKSNTSRPKEKPAKEDKPPARPQKPPKRTG
jgi:hypothetical protein